MTPFVMDDDDNAAAPESACPSCGHAYCPEDRYCRYCGQRRDDAAFAPEKNERRVQSIYGAPMPSDYWRVMHKVYELNWRLVMSRHEWCIVKAGSAFGRGNSRIAAVEQDRAISREHLLFTAETGDTITAEIRGRNGLTVNGKHYAMGETVTLRSFDRIVLGSGVEIGVWHGLENEFDWPSPDDTQRRN